MVKPDRSQMTILHGTGYVSLHTHSEYIVLVLHSNNCYGNTPQSYVYVYIVCLVGFVLKFLLSFSGCGKNTAVILCMHFNLLIINIMSVMCPFHFASCTISKMQVI